MTVAEAAERLACSEPTVLRRIYAGELDAEKAGKSWAIDAESIERHLADRDAEITAYVEKQTRGEALAHAAAEGYWTSTADVLELCREAILAFDDFEKMRDAEPVAVQERTETLVVKLDELLDRLVARKAYSALAEDAAGLLSEAARLARGGGS